MGAEKPHQDGAAFDRGAERTEVSGEQRVTFTKTPAQKREETFEMIFKHWSAMAGLYVSVKDMAPEEATAGLRMKDWLERHKDKLRAEVMKP